MSISLIFSGQANIIVEPHKHPKQYPQLWPFEAGIDIYSIEFEFLRYTSGADPGLQVRGGAHLKKLRPAEGGAKNFGVFRVKNHDFTPKNHIFYQF
jgi:hypothetical protein